MSTPVHPTPAVAKSPSSQRKLPWPLADIHAACGELAAINPTDTHAVAALLQRMMLDYYADIRIQAQRVLYFVAVPTAFFGLVSFAIGFALKTNIQVRYWVIAGLALEVIAAICFFSYARASRRLALFDVGLERTNRFILADALCQHLDGEARTKARHRLVNVVAEASLLTVDGAGQQWAETVVERDPAQHKPGGSQRRQPEEFLTPASAAGL